MTTIAYTGHRDTGKPGPGTVLRIDENGSRTPLSPRNDLVNHSPDGFNWGYAGSGASQLALALLADATGDDKLALRTYMRFKFEMIVDLPADWTMDRENIAAFAKALDGAPLV